MLQMLWRNAQVNGRPGRRTDRGDLCRAPELYREDQGIKGAPGEQDAPLHLKSIRCWQEGESCTHDAAFLIIDDILKLAQRLGNYRLGPPEDRRQLLSGDRIAAREQPDERWEVHHPLPGAARRDRDGEVLHTRF